MLSAIFLGLLATGQIGTLAEDAVVITSSVAAPEGRRPARLLGSFLRDRTFETYGISAGVSTTAATRFEIHLTFPDAKVFSVAVAERGALLGERDFDRSSFDESVFEAWVFVRAQFEQALLVELAEATPAIPTSTVAASPAAQEVPPTEAVASATVPSEDQPRGPYAIAGLALGILDGDLRSGLAIQGRIDLGGRLTATLEIGYRQSQPLASLQVIHVPLSAGIGVVLEPSIPIEVGVSGTFDPRIVVGDNAAGLGAGLSAGPYGRVRLPFGAIDFVGELGLPIGLYRQAYTQGSERTVDPLVAVRVGLGVEYRWP